MLLALAACTQAPLLPPLPPLSALPSQILAHTEWSGRWVLKLGDEGAPSFSAGFELQGNAARGRLLLLSPFGTVLAQIDWEPHQAQLHTGDQVRQFSSLEALLENLENLQPLQPLQPLESTAKIPIPVAALFDWLAGTPTVTTTGWEADLTAIGQGKMTAVRSTSGSQATLHIQLER